MRKSPGELCFIQVSSLDGKPPVEQAGAIKSQAMRDYLRKNPRRRTHKSRFAAFPGCQTLDDCGLGQGSVAAQSLAPAQTTVSTQGSTSEQIPASRQVPSSIRVLSLGRARFVVEASPGKSTKSKKKRKQPNREEEAGVLGVLSAGNPSPSNAIFASSQYKIQVRDVVCRLFWTGQKECHNVLVNVEDMVQDVSNMPIVASAIDAVMLIHIAALRNDKSCLIYAMTNYQQALAGVRKAVLRPGTPKHLNDLILVTFLFSIYETIACSKFLNNGYVHHAQALGFLLKARLRHRRYPLNDSLRMVESSCIPITFFIGLKTRKRADNKPKEMDSLLPHHDLPIFRAITRVPDILENLQTPASLPTRCNQISTKDITEAFQLWTEITTLYQTWLRDRPGRNASITSLRTFPQFGAMVTPDVCQHVTWAYAFANSHILLIHRQVWTALIVLGNDLLHTLTSQSSPSGGDAHAAKTTNAHGHDVSMEDLRRHVAKHADDLCRVLPYMIETMAGQGRVHCRAIIFFLREYFLNPAGEPPNMEKLDFLDMIQDTFFLGSAVERMLV